MIRKIILPIIVFFFLTGAAFKYGGIKHDITSTAKSGAITTLTASSSQVEAFTGTSAQTVKLPSGLTLSNGYWYTIINQGTTGSVVVQDASASVLATLTASQSSTFYMNNAAVIGGNWSMAPGAGSSSGGGGSSGALCSTFLTKAATYSVLTTDSGLLANTLGTTQIEFDLPSASNKMNLCIKNIGTGSLIVVPNGADIIDGDPNMTLGTASASVILISDGASTWWIF
jgi:hypothetical protein